MKTIQNGFVALLSISLLAMAGCRKDPVDPVPPVNGQDTTEQAQSSLRLRLVPTWEGQPFQPYVEHINSTNYRVQVEKVQFYLGDIAVMREGVSTILSRSEFIDFNDGPVEIYLPVTAGTWDGLSLGLGVPEDLNHSDPTLYDGNHPLSVSNGMHWNWTSGYVFLKFEGRYDLDPNSTGQFETAYSIHTGFDEVYKEISFQPGQPYIFSASDTATVTIRVAIDDFFHSEAGGTIDLATENQSHGMNVPLSEKLATNAANSFTLE